MASHRPNSGDDGDEDAMEENSGEILPGYADVNTYSQAVLRSVLTCVKSSNDLPTGDDFDFYSSFRSVRDVLDVESNRVLNLIQSILHHQGVKGNISQTNDDVEIEDKFDVLIDANDLILERVGTALDEASGIRKEESKLVVAAATPSSSQKASWNKSKTSSMSPVCRLLSAKNILRPQLKFKEKIDNSNTPFIPILREKPNALRSLEESLRLPEGVSLETAESPDFVYPHPYAYEIDHLEYRPSHLEPAPIKMPDPVSLTPFTMVTEAGQLPSLLHHLKQQEEFAVDLEHHSYRSFQGFTCLMQLSTRSQDFLVDTIALRSDLHVLNEVFTDPAICKVFHGADSDIGWLQRDFGIYVVNMFDTGQAARVLGMAHFALKYLLEVYCNVSVDKQFQLADWRIRPLFEELIVYARTDTHYLLYVASKMKAELLEKGNAQKNLLLAAFQRSANVTRLVYKKPVYHEDGWEELLRRKRKGHYNSQHRHAFHGLHAWRDRTARREDEGLQFVLPDHMLFKISETLPRELQGVLACCDPIPPYVRREAPELHRIIRAARDTPIVKVEVKKRKRPDVKQHPRYDASSLLTCPHDWSHVNSSTDSSRGKKNMEPVTVLDCPSLSALASPVYGHKSAAAQRAAEIRASFEDPFRRFLPDESGLDTSTGSADTSQNASGSQSDLDLVITPITKGLWRLKPHSDQRRKASDSKSPHTPLYAPPKKRVKIDTTAPPKFRMEEEKKGEISLKDQVLEERKKKKKKKHREDLEDVILEKKKKSMPTILGEDMEMDLSDDAPIPEEAEASDFQSYDYNAADKSMFEGGSNRKHDVYDPGRSSQKDKKKAQANKMRQPRGISHRNQTFSGPSHQGRHQR